MKWSKPLVIGLMAVAAASVVAALGLMGSKKPSEQDIKAMQTFTNNMKTVCLGRYLIDIPAIAEMNNGAYQFKISDVNVRKKGAQSMQSMLDTVDSDINTQASAIKNSGLTMYKKSRPVFIYKPGEYIRSIKYMPVTSDEDDTKMDAYIIRPGGIFFFSANALDDLEAKNINDSLVEMEPNLSIRDDNEIPKTPGFCIQGGFIAMKPDPHEQASNIFELPGHPDVSFGISTRINNDKVWPGIVDRKAEIEKEAGPAVNAKTKTLRIGQVDIAGFKAQEWLVEISDDPPEYQFDLDIPGNANSFNAPAISMALKAGGQTKDGRVKPSLTPGEAIALWDAIIHSFRVRPGAF